MASTNTLCKKLLNVKTAVVTGSDFYTDEDGVIFWLIHILNMIFAIGKYDMMCYFMAGDYWMICLDLLNKNKTAIVKEKKSS